MFLHIGVFHLLFNLYALNALGPLVEGYFWPCALPGDLPDRGCSAVWRVTLLVRAVGGRIRGYLRLAGATTVYFLRYRENFGSAAPSCRTCCSSSASTWSLASPPGIDNWGHVGGLVGGARRLWPAARYAAPCRDPARVTALQEETLMFHYAVGHSLYRRAGPRRRIRHTGQTPLRRKSGTWERTALAVAATSFVQLGAD